jgi:hypothetical protein
LNRVEIEQENVMSLPPDDPPASGDELQFDHVEQDNEQPQAATCATCHQPIVDAYYEINGKTICARCREITVQSLAGGSRWGRFVRAAIFGSVAGLIGAAIWGGIRAFTGYDLGLIAVLVGVIVGTAVRAGSRGRGGLAYQFLAVVLTYSSVAASIMPAVLIGMNESFETERQKQQLSDAGTTTMPVAATAPESEQDAGASLENMSTAGKFGAVCMALAFTFIFSAIVPIMSGDILWMLIISFALWEAWKINKAQKLVINGPFQLSTTSMQGETTPDHQT